MTTSNDDEHDTHKIEVHNLFMAVYLCALWVMYQFLGSGLWLERCTGPRLVA